MLIQRLTTPTFSLIDNSTLAEWLRIDVGTDAGSTAMLLASATDYIQTVSGRVLGAADYTISYDGDLSVLPISLFPINSIKSVVLALADGTTSTLVNNVDYVASLISLPAIMVAYPPDNAVSATVTLNAGYTSQASVPASLQHAAAILVAAGYDNRSELDPQTMTTVSALIANHRRFFL